MTSDWPQKRLGELAELKGRIGWRGLTAKEYTSAGPLFLSVPSLNYGDYVDYRDAVHITEARYQESPEIMLRQNDVLVCKDGAGIGKAGIVGELPDRATINSSLLLVRSGPSIRPKFLYRCLCSPYFQAIVNSRLNGATTPHLYQRDITEFPVVLPPLEEQDRLVALLDEAFECIAGAIANTESNLRNARAVFESYLDSMFSHKSRLWDRHAELQSLTTPDSAITYGVVKPGREGDVRFVRGGDLARGHVAIGQLRTITGAVSQQYRRTLLRGGELLISLVGQPGQVAVAPPELSGANIARQVGLIRLCEDMDAEFVSLFLRSTVGQAALGARQSGSVQQVINLGELRQVHVPTPARSVQAEVVRGARLIEDATLRLESVYRQKTNSLAELRESLLNEAFSGKL